MVWSSKLPRNPKRICLAFAVFPCAVRGMVACTGCGSAGARYVCVVAGSPFCGDEACHTRSHGVQCGPQGMKRDLDTRDKEDAEHEARPIERGQGEATGHAVVATFHGQSSVVGPT